MHHEFPSKRLLAAFASIVGMLSVAGCATTDWDNRHLRPLPSALVAQMSAKGMSTTDPIFVRIFKKESELEVWKRARSGDFELLKTYPMCRWSGQLGPKRREGDRQAPEGFYTVTPQRMNPRSQFYLSFDLGFPNALETRLGYTGSALMVHGACTSSGCFAMTNDGVAEIYGLAREAFAGGQASFQVQALPFRMTAENVVRHRRSPHMAFWRNLKEGSDHFEATRQPPKVAACGGRYVFNARESGVSFDAVSPCPPFEVELSVRDRVAAKRAEDDLRIAELTKNLIAPLEFAYADGGMHTSFRSLLRSVGPDRLKSLVAGGVEISRPDAALADPFVE